MEVHNRPHQSRSDMMAGTCVPDVQDAVNATTVRKASRPIGKQHSPLAVILLSIVTLGLYSII